MSLDKKLDDRSERAMALALDHMVVRFAPPPDDLVQRSVERGERKRRRARTAQLAGGVAAVTVIGLGGVLLPTEDSPPTTPLQQAASPLAPSPTPTDATSAPAPVDLRERLVAMLPARGKVTGGTENGLEYATVLFDDGKGAGLVSITAQNSMTDAVKDQMNCDQAPVECQTETTSDGTIVKSYQETTDRAGQVQCNTVDTLRPDGRRVVVSACNAADDAGPRTRAKPVLSLDEVRSIVLDPRWTSVAGGPSDGPGKR